MKTAVRFQARVSLAIWLVIGWSTVVWAGHQGFTFTKVDLDLLEQARLLDERMEKDGLVYRDEALTAYIERLGRGLAGEAPERVVWRFRVMRDPLANAFALPNGSIYVNTGLLALLENEAQLAGVLAHEINHVTGRHAYLAQRSYRKKMGAIHIFQAAGAWVPVGSIVGASISIVAGVAPYILAATISGYQRELEQEADTYAVNRIYESGYDPRELVNTFKLLQHSLEVEMVKIYYTDHPKLQERIAAVNQFIQSRPAAAPTAAESGKGYLALRARAVRHNVRLDIESGRSRTAIAVSQKLVAADPEQPENLLCLAEAYRTLGPRSPEPTAVERSEKALKEARKLKHRLTPDEQDTALMATSSGQSAWTANQAKAEETYKRVLSLDSAAADAHRGLGMLYERTNRPREAVAEFRRYLELRPNAADRMRVQRRIDALTPSLRNNDQ